MKHIIEKLGRRESLRIFNILMSDFISKHPLPWTKDQDWTSSLTDAQNTEIIHDCKEATDTFISIAIEQITNGKIYTDEKGSLRLLDIIIQDLSIKYKSPWQKEIGQTTSIRNKNNEIEIIHDCKSEDVADTLIALAMEYEEDLKKGGKELEEQLDLPPGTIVPVS